MAKATVNKAVKAAKPAKKTAAKEEKENKHLKQVTGFLPSFVQFIREQGVVGLAVGLAIGTAAGASVKVIVTEFISPLVALLTRGVDLTSLKWIIIEKSTNQPEVAIGWGAIISSFITLLATAFVIYWLVHVAKLDKLDKKKTA